MLSFNRPGTTIPPESPRRRSPARSSAREPPCSCDGSHPHRRGGQTVGRSEQGYARAGSRSIDYAAVDDPRRFPSAVIVAAPHAAFEPLPRVSPPVSVVNDRIPGCGPLGGLHAALCVVETSLAFVCAGDMPRLSGDLLDLMVERSAPGRCLVPVRAGRPEPLHAIYPASLRDGAERALGEGVRMLLDFLARAPVDYLKEEEYLGVAGAAASFDNINTVEDLERIRASRGA